MSTPPINSFIATTSGLCGGLGKAFTANLILTNISFPGILEVGVYAAVSALVGYGVKKGIDALINLLRRRK